MKRTLLSLAALALAAGFVAAGKPQTSKSIPKLAPPAPVSFDGAMKKVKLKFETDADGDYKAEIAWNAEKRSQIVFVRGKAAQIQDQKLRDIWSICWRGDGAPDAATMEKLLTARMKAGAFQLEKDERGKWTAYFRIDVPEDSRPAYLERLINMTAEVADDMEKDLTNTDDL